MSEETFAYQIHKDVPIEGVKEIRRATAALDSYRIQRRDFVEGDNTNFPKRPEVDIYALQQQYPRAAAYLKAERWYNSPGFRKSDLGKKAMDRILAGEDHTKVLEDMHNAWAAFRVAQEG